MKKIIILIFLFLFFSNTISAESETAVNLEIFNNLIRYDSNEWLYLYSGSAGLSMTAEGNRNVKGEIAFSLKDFSPAASENENAQTASKPEPDFQIDKLYIKVRFPFFRLTSGKTRLSWGEGNAFNAGDVLFGSDDINIDMTSEVLRNQNKWLTSMFLPFSDFVFLETVILAPPDEGTKNIKESSAGARFYATPGKWKTEAGYLYSGDDIGKHKPYISLKVNVEVDIYFSSSASIPENDKKFSAWNESWKISTGIFYMINLPSDHSLTLRLESIIAPYGSWNDNNSFRTISDPAGGTIITEGDIPGIIIYPEIIWNTGNSGFSLGLSSLISPLDNSYRTAVFSNWEVYQGFSFIGTAVLETGETKDLFGFYRAGGVIVSLGARYKF